MYYFRNSLKIISGKFPGIIILLTLLLPLLNSCKKHDEKPEQEKIYTIRKGQHYSDGSTISKLSGESLSFKATFNHSAIYTLKDTVQQASINKLYGFSDCDAGHHTNSARFGWRWFEEKLEIFAYCYSNGERNNQFITSIDLNKEYQYTIEAVDHKYIFWLNNQRVEMDRGCSGKSTKYRLFPYFGGTSTAPHEITISIKE